MNRKKLFNILKVLVSAALLIFIFSRIELAKVFAVILQADRFWLAAALVMTLVGVLIRVYRWRILLDAIDVRVSVPELTAIYFIGFLFNNLLPSGLGGDAIRMIELNRHSERGSDAVTSVIVDRFLGLSALQAIALVALLFDWQAVPALFAYFTVAIFVAGLGLGYVLINRPIYTALQRVPILKQLLQITMIASLFESFQRYPLTALGRSYGVSLLFNLSLIAMNVCLGWALGAQASVAQYAIFVPITSLVLVIPITFAGLGLREETYIQLFGQIGVPEPIAVGMSLSVYVLGNIVTGLIGAGIYLVRSSRSVMVEQEKV